MEEKLESLYEEIEFSESIIGYIITVIAFIVSFPFKLLGLIFNIKLETGEEKRKKEILEIKNEMGLDWFSYDEWKKTNQIEENKNLSGKLFESLKIVIGIFLVISIIIAFWSFIFSDTFSYFVVVVWPLIGGIFLLFLYRHNKMQKKKDVDKTSQ